MATHSEEELRRAAALICQAIMQKAHLWFANHKNNIILRFANQNYGLIFGFLNPKE